MNNVKKLLEKCVEARRGRTDVELEMRLGQCSDTFRAGIPRVMFEQLESDLAEAHGLSAETGYTELVDYFYTLSRGQQIRTRVHYDSSRMEIRTEHVEKRLLHSLVASVSDDPGDACRLEVSTETAVESPPQSTLINYVRVKQRRTFIDRRQGGDVWRYELSRTWSGTTRDAVEYSQHNAEPTYEVECELVDENGAYMEERSDREVADSLHMKVLMLLGYDDVDTVVDVSHIKGCCAGGGAKRVRVDAGSGEKRQATR